MSENFIFSTNLGKNYPQSFIPDAKEAREKALMDGDNAFSHYAYSKDPTKHEAEKDSPILYGDFVLHFMLIDNPFDSIAFAQEFVHRLLHNIKGCNPEVFQYFLDGNEALFLSIPAEMYGGD